MPFTQNFLLASLTGADARALMDQLEPVDLVFGSVLHEPGEPLGDVYFPLEGLVSLLTLVEDHLALEVGMVGREGMVGYGLSLGAASSPMRALVQGAGTALKMSRAGFVTVLDRSPPLQQAILAYVDSLMAQVARTAACNRFHVVEARLARWLLMTRDRAGSGDFEMTQEFLSSMLGVRRVGVSKAASTFQRSKLIEYSRGHIRILDHDGLEAACCSCYREEPGAIAPWRPSGAWKGASAVASATS